MASYAVLGATGNTGTSLIQNILRKPDAKVHAYCRNKNKLLRLLPEIVDNKDVQIFEGSIHDKDLITECIRGTRAAFLVVTTNTNVPGCCMAQDVTRTVLAALEKIKSEGPLGYPLPKVVLLSSATIDDHLARKMPGWFRPIMLRAGSFVYDDLRAAEALLRAEEAWLSSIFIKPGGLAVDQQRGHVLNMDEEESFISFLDLAAAMLEAADDPEARYDMKNVSVTNANGAAAFPKKTVLCILTGLLRHYFPYLHPYLPEGTPC